MNNIRRTAKRLGWEGPYRYQLPGTRGFIHGWIIKRGRIWLQFVSIRDGRSRVPLTEERYMEKIS